MKSSFLTRTFFLIMILFAFSLNAHATIVVAPKDLPTILSKIGKYEKKHYPFLGTPAKMLEQEGKVVLVNQAGDSNSTTGFGDGETIAKHMRLPIADQQYAFAAILQPHGSAFEHTISQVNGRDVVVFFNDIDVFVYTQAMTPDGNVELKEWIYARKPNVVEGSIWSWVFKSEPWQWPLSLDINATGQAQVSRNLPFMMKGMTITGNTRKAFMLQMMVHYNDDAAVTKYFPYRDPIAILAPADFLTQEGVKRHGNIAVTNASVIGKSPKPKHGLNLAAWDDHWQSTFVFSVKASPREYPILVTP